MGSCSVFVGFVVSIFALVRGSDSHRRYDFIMDDGKGGNMLSSKDKIIQIYSDFMTRITEFDELVTKGSKLLMTFHQALEFLGRPPINKTSTLIERIIGANGTKRFYGYAEAGCKNTHDNALNVSKSQVIVSELECLLDDAATAVRTAKLQDEDVDCNIDSLTAITNDKEQVLSSDLSKLKVTEYASMMAIIYSMVKQDLAMQDRIVSSLNLKSSTGELETYCQMWSLRPFLDDDLAHKAWILLPCSSLSSK